MLLGFDLIANCNWEIAKKPASYELAIRTIFFYIFYIHYFKRDFWILSNEHFDRRHYTKFSIVTREFYI